MYFEFLKDENETNHKIDKNMKNLERHIVIKNVPEGSYLKETMALGEIFGNPYGFIREYWDEDNIDVDDVNYIKDNFDNVLDYILQY